MRTIQKENKEKLTFENCPDVMDGKEVAELLHVSPKTINRLAVTNEIDSFLIGTARRFTRRSLFKFIYERTGDEQFNVKDFKTGDLSFIHNDLPSHNDYEASL